MAFALHSVAICSTHQSKKINSSLTHKHTINVKVRGGRKGGREGKEERGKKREAVDPKRGLCKLQYSA